ncbi:hypothetical protein [Kitasatospora sp. NPDC093679]|uniref:hypothetical protein n=1 Tax=Kitasatospora sp. NPDC093679 TaxID=3154983 RepID=UPI003435577F
MSTIAVRPTGKTDLADRLLMALLAVAAFKTRAVEALSRRIQAAKAREEGGYTAVELILITAAVIVVVGIAVVAIKAAVTTKSTSVGNCITGADTTNNGGCN